MILNRVFNNRQFSTLFDHISIGILIVNAEGEIVSANKYLLCQFGYNETELLYQKIEHLIPEQYRDQHKSVRAKFSKHSLNITLAPEKNLKGIRKDGSEFPVEMSLGFYKENDDTYYVAFINDLTPKKEAEGTIKQLTADLDQRVKEGTRSLSNIVDQLIRQLEENERKDAELVKALEKEKELNQLKSRFVSVASHEFRTPLSGILASTYLLSKYTKEDQQGLRDKHIKRILSSVNLLNEVLGDFLSVDKMEQGNFKPNLTVFNISTVVNEIIQNMQHLLKNGQRISYMHNDENDIAYLDHSMFHHILTNLLSNAIKYSPEDTKIDLIIEQKDHTLIIKVKDRGIGIPEKEQQNLYKRFFRSSNAAQIQGTGLGLNIVKKYVEILDGAIECISEENVGTEFIIRFNNQKEHYENSISS